MSALLDRCPDHAVAARPFGRAPVCPRDRGAPNKLRVVAHRCGGETSIGELPAAFAVIANARREVDRLRAEQDEDCSTVTDCVVDAAGVPIYRALTTG